MQLLEDDLVINEEENVEVQDIFIAPPPPNELTDEDSGGLLDNLPRSQLMSEAEAVFSNHVRIGSTTNYDFSGYSAKRDLEWIEGDHVDPLKKDIIFPEGYPQKYTILSPVEMFELFINEDVISLFVTETKKMLFPKMKTI